MNFAKRYVLGLSILFAAVCASARGDVGSCWVLFVYQGQTGLNAEQQKEVAERLTTAHMNSGGSDRHTLFICYFDASEEGVLYRIHTIENEILAASERFAITARDFDAMREAIADVEQAFEKGGPELRVRKITPATPGKEK